MNANIIHVNYSLSEYEPLLEYHKLNEYVEQLIEDYYKMKEGTRMTGDMRTMAIQLPEELFERLKAYLKQNKLSQKQFIIGLIEDALEQNEEQNTSQRTGE